MVDPTDERHEHPEQAPAPMPRPGHPLLLLDASRVKIIHRPRFTNSEILLLNRLINESPEPVFIDELRALLVPFGVGYPTTASIKQHVTHIRAKLGEQRNHPVQIISVKERIDNPWGVPWLTVVGYRWNNNAEPDQ